MPISKVADRATANSNAAVTTVDLVLSSMTVGNTLIIRCAADNSGGGGAARTCTVTNQSGTPINVATDVQASVNNDPGSASAGITGFLMWAAITATSGTVRLTFSGSVVCSVVAEEWSGIESLPSGSTTTNITTASTFFASVTAGTPSRIGDMVYVMVGAEGPSSDTYTGDSDTTGGSWSSLTKLGTSNATADTNQTVWGQYKVTTTLDTQSWGAPDGGTLNNARDTVLISAVFPTTDRIAAPATVATVSTIGAARIQSPPSFEYRNSSTRWICDRGHGASSPIYMGNGRFIGGGGYIADPINADSAEVWAFKSETDFSAWLNDFSASVSVQSTYGGSSVKLVKVNNNGVFFHQHSIGRINSTQVACQWQVIGSSLYNDSTHTITGQSRSQVQQAGGCSVVGDFIARFSDDRVLYGYSQDAVTKINCWQLNSTTGAFIAAGTEVTLVSATAYTQTCPLDESTVALSAYLSGTDVIVRVLNVSSAGAITLGSTNTLTLNASSLAALLEIDSTHAYVIYTNSTGDQVYRVLTVSGGDTVTAGSENILWSRGFAPTCTYLGSNRYGFIESGAFAASAERSWVFERNTGTNALTNVSSFPVPDKSLQNPSIYRIDSTHHGIGWQTPTGTILNSVSALLPYTRIYDTVPVTTTPEFVNAVGTAATVVAASSGTTLASSTAMPAGVVPGDLLIMSVASNAADTITTPAGYTAIVTAVNDAALSHGWYYRIADGTSADYPTVTFSTTATASIGHFIRMYAFKGVNSASPFEDATVTAVTTSTTPTGDAVATSGSDRLEVQLVVADAATTWSSGNPPSGYTSIGLLSTTVGGDAMTDGIYQSRPSSGAGSAPTLGTMSSSVPWAVLSLALKPAPSPHAIFGVSSVATTSSVGAPVVTTISPPAPPLLRQPRVAGPWRAIITR